ncbi:MAG: trypsin-like peptidase domain-containing protein [Polyangiaceae bacterium]
MESLFLSVRTSPDAAAKRARGTAWLLWPRFVVTALHVVGTPGGAGAWAHERWLKKRPEEVEKGAEPYALRLPSGDAVGVLPIAYDPIADVALLRLPEGATVAEDAFGVIAVDAVRAGDPWHAVGYPAFEEEPRAIALEGAVSFVGAGLTNNAIQLQVDQGTGVAWGGISGCAARSTWGEVIGVVLQTMSGIATCNAAPAEVVARLLRLHAHLPELVDALSERLRALGSDAIEDVANNLFPSLSGADRFAADPAGVLAARVAESGGGGLRLALDAIRDAMIAAGKKPPDAAVDPIVGRFETAVMARPSEADKGAVLRALADEGGEIDAIERLAKRLPDMPRAVLDAAVSALLLEAGQTTGNAKPVRGMRGADDVITLLTLLAEGARRIVRRDYLRAVLRALRSGDATRAELDARCAIGPAALSRTLVCAERIGAIARLGDAFRLTSSGPAWLAMRPGDAEPAR